jgi:hypothetical protein
MNTEGQRVLRVAYNQETKDVDQRGHDDCDLWLNSATSALKRHDG